MASKKKSKQSGPVPGQQVTVKLPHGHEVVGYVTSANWNFQPADLIAADLEISVGKLPEPKEEAIADLSQIESDLTKLPEVGMVTKASYEKAMSNYKTAAYQMDWLLSSTSTLDPVKNLENYLTGVMKEIVYGIQNGGFKVSSPMKVAAAVPSAYPFHSIDFHDTSPGATPDHIKYVSLTLKED